MQNVQSKGYKITSATKISANAEIEVGRSSYLLEGQWDQTRIVIDNFISEYGSKAATKEVFTWSLDSNTMSLGCLLNEGGIVKLYYVSIRVR